MHDFERYSLWAAIVTLFILYFWPSNSSNYSGEPKSITKLAEFSGLNDEIKRVYNDNIMRAIKAWVPVLNKWWSELKPVEKTDIIKIVKDAADFQVKNAEDAKTVSGSQALERSRASRAPQITEIIIPSTQSMPAQQPGAVSTPVTTVSSYMAMPMISGFTMEDLSMATKFV